MFWVWGVCCFVVFLCFCFLFCKCFGIPNSPRSLDLDDRQGLIASSAMQKKKSIPVANPSCKFYLHWGKHSQTQKQNKQIPSRFQVSMIDALANASPNVIRICNWNATGMQLECNCRKLHTRICNWKNPRNGSPCE